MTRLDPGPEVACPFVPEGASEWETHEIRRHWRNALSALDDVQRGLLYDADRLLRRGKHAVPADADVRYDHRLQGGGLTYHAMQAEAEMVALARVVDGAVHRQAMLEQADA